MGKKLFYIVFAIMLLSSTGSRQIALPVYKAASCNVTFFHLPGNGINNHGTLQVKGKAPARPRFIIRIKALNECWVNAPSVQWLPPRLFPLPRAAHLSGNYQFYNTLSSGALLLRGPPAAVA